MVVFPHGVHPLFVGTKSSIVALDSAMADDKQIFLVAKKESDKTDLEPADLYQMGTVATILQLLKLPDGTVKVLVEGGSRAAVKDIDVSDEFIRAEVEIQPELEIERREADAIVRSLLTHFEQYAQGNKKIPQEVLASLSGLDDPSRLMDTMAAQMALEMHDRQKILETVEIKTRMERLLGLMDAGLALQQVDKQVRGRVKKQMEQSQRDYYLNEQMKAIQKEMGDDSGSEMDELQAKIEAAGHAQRSQGQGANRA
jgi:ATP-dependent Lon protease